MPSSPFHRILRPFLLTIFILECSAFVFLMYFKPTMSLLEGLVEILAPTGQFKNVSSPESNKGVTSVLINDLNVGSSLFNIEDSPLLTRTYTKKSDWLIVYYAHTPFTTTIAPFVQSAIDAAAVLSGTYVDEFGITVILVTAALDWTLS